MAVLAQLVDGVVATRFDVDQLELTIGRHPNNTVQIDEDAVSSHHAVIRVETNAHFKDYKEYYLEDLKSTNGTFVNEERVIGKIRLRNNDVVRLAWNKFKFLDELEGRMDRTVHIVSDE